MSAFLYDTPWRRPKDGSSRCGSVVGRHLTLVADDDASANRSRSFLWPGQVRGEVAFKAARYGENSVRFVA